MTLLFSVALSMLAALACAQPQNVPPRTTRAITLIGNNLYLYGGSSSGGDCYSDLFSLSLNPADGWIVADAPWNSITTTGDTPVLGADSWAVGAANGAGLLVYGQSLCRQNLDKSANPPHTYTSSSGSALFQNTDEKWGLVRTASNIFGNRSVMDDQPVPVQVVDTQGQVAYTFEYDLFNPQLGMQLWSFPTGNLATNIAEFAKNTTMPTSLPPTPAPLPPANGTNATVLAPQAPVSTTLAPWIDTGSAVFVSGTIVVIGGGKDAGERLTGDNYDAASGHLKMDRCWVYTIATNEWAVRNLTGDGGSFPLPRRLHALAAVGSKVYMHGGNTTQTIPTDSYASDMWILDTQTWAWTKAPSSSQGRAQHTLIFTNNNLLAVSGFQFLTSPTKAAQNSFISVYDLATSTWGVQFGTVNQTYFQKHGAAIIGGSVAGFLVLVVIAAVLRRLFRKRRGPRKSAGTMIGGAAGNPKRSRSFKPFLTSRSDNNDATARGAASELSGMTLNNNSHEQQQQQRPYETEIDLSSMPRASKSTVYQSYNPYAPTKQQQQVPLMSANALEQQRNTMDPYADDDGDVEQKDAPIDFRMPPHGQIGSPVLEHVYPGQTAPIAGETVDIPGALMRPERVVREDSVDYL
ncbi:hypothetical protein BGZ47_008462 [Haplosporangium gracile]|nr:hypothetical protein BGZ47_008462 [Haplosporangium gracile]